jgi:phage tail sheath protein FI
MAEKVVSPGVFTNEKDLSFLPAGIAQIGAAIVGPTMKGPAFVPTPVESFNDYKEKFGGLNPDFYAPYAVQQYMKNAGRVTVVRVLHLGGYSVSNPLFIYGAASGSAATDASSSGTDLTENLMAVLAPTVQNPTGDFASSSLYEIGASAAELASGASGSLDFGVHYAQINSSVFGLELSGSGVSSALYTASLSSGNDNYLTKVFGENPRGDKEAYVYLNLPMNQTNITPAAISISGSAGTAPSEAIGAASSGSGVFASTPMDFTKDYQPAISPYIVSQKVGGAAVNLFRFRTHSHGSNVNKIAKIMIGDIRPPSIAKAGINQDYGDFTVTIRGVKNYHGSEDTERSPDNKAVYQKVNLDKDSPRYVEKVIGSQYYTVNSDGKLVLQGGTYPSTDDNLLIEVVDGVKNKTLSKDLVPGGYGKISVPVNDGAEGILAASQIAQQIDDDENVNYNVAYGYNYWSGSEALYQQNLNYLAPLPDSALETNQADFDLFAQLGTVGAVSPYVNAGVTLSLTTGSAAQRKFMVPMQGGFDGKNPAADVKTGSNIVNTNSQGFDCSSATASGSVAYVRALNAVSNPDEFDINMIVVPGILQGIHPTVTTKAKNVAEARADAFYVMDAFEYSTSVSSATTQLTSFDSSYVATYYPWVQIRDVDNNTYIWAPPSVPVAGVIAQNDALAHEWFAPAGLNRGITDAVQVKSRLTLAERDDLYEARINPIATFPGQGICIWGQKTLQIKPSALDRVNVRRLLIAVKKFIASATKFLVFEQNNAATRNRFLGIVNPYLESVQQRSGLSAFKVVMDDSNNTPDLVDRNIMYGQIFLQPTRTAEFIILDFNILPTGAAFPE